MTLAELRTALYVDCSDVHFNYHNKFAGIEITAEDGVVTYEAWFGDKSKLYHNVDAVIADEFFDGKSLADLLAEGVEFWF